MAKFVKLSGEEIDCSVPAGSRAGDASGLLVRQLKAAVRLIDESGRVLEAHDPLPEGVLQVQVMSIHPGQWYDLYCGALLGFDEEKLRQAVASAWPGDFHRKGADPMGGEDVEVQDWQAETREALQGAVLEVAGPWADYWTFAQSADSYTYPYVRPPYVTLAPSVDLMVNDLKRWQKLVLELESDFAALRTRCSELPLCEHLETAIATLLKHSPDFRTEERTWVVGFEMWYEPFSMLVKWYLSSAGFEEEVDLLQQVQTAISGFQSYHCPPHTASSVVEGVAKERHLRWQKVNSTSEWMAVRGSLTCTAVEVKEVEKEDSHRKFIAGVDEPRSSLRARNLVHALAQCRMDAGTTQALTWSELTEWHRLLAQGLWHWFPGKFREHDAYAKRGRECYPIEDGTVANFLACLAQANSTEPLALRAMRAYLDVLFFHPFDDGNSRLARLVMDFLMSREGCCLQNVEPVFLFSKLAGDLPGHQSMVDLVQKLMRKKGPGFGADVIGGSAAFPEMRYDRTVPITWFDCQRYPDDVPP